MNRPGPLPIQSLQEPLTITAQNAIYTDSRAAAMSLSSSANLTLIPVSFAHRGLRLTAAGPLNLDGAKGAFFLFADGRGQRICVYEFDAADRMLPKGKDLSAYGIPARMVRGIGGCSHLYWPQRNLLIVVCTHGLDIGASAGVALSVSEQLQRS
ncbi:MAG: hypothetical protein WCL39_14365 [Armatimonadota bacterium]